MKSMNETPRGRAVSPWLTCVLGALLLALQPSCGESPREAPGGASRDGSTPAAEPVAGPNAPNTLTPDEEAQGWMLLFDGESFAGWRGLGREVIPRGHWVIEDGMIRKVASGEVPTAPDGQPLEGGDIMTEEAWEDFELVLEWRVAPGANSGIKYNVSEAMSTSLPPIHAALGFEYQILDDDLHPDALNGPNRTAGALYDLVPPGADRALLPVGSFNEARIVFRGPHGEHWLNGVKVLEFDLDSEAFDSAFAASKYLPIEGFVAKRRGHIILQDHGDDVWFRSIKLREITP
ncbi:DUF1080 domain-containing protein [Gemmatimonadota bacterium]